MIFPAEAVPLDATRMIVTSLLIFVCSALAIAVGYAPLKTVILRQERMFENVLRGRLLIDVRPRHATIATGAVMAVLAIVLYAVVGSLAGALLGLGVGAALPQAVLAILQRRRLARLEHQLVGGIQTLSSAVRAGLNLIQAMQLVSRDGPVPLRQEFAHLMREYEFGTPLEEAMGHAADRIGSPDYRLLFSALRTHRERGGDLGETLDRIAESVREIQRLENRVTTLTAQGRATARWLGAMPAAVLLILFVLVDPHGVKALFATDVGKMILFAIVLLNIIGFLWIKKIVTLDI